MEREREGAAGGSGDSSANRRPRTSSFSVPSNVRVRLLVFNVCKGVETAVQANEDTPIYKIKEKVQDILQVRMENQVLLLEDGTKVHNVKKVDSYPSLLNPNDHQVLYLFDNRFANPRIVLETLHPLENARILPPKPSFSRSGLLDDLDVDYQEFVYELKYAQATLESINSRINSMKSKWRECELQLRAVEVVINSVKKPVDSLREKRESFKKEYEKHAEKVNKLLSSFEDDVSLLKKSTVPPILKSGKTAQYTTLIDFTPENKLRDWKDEVKAKNDSITLLVNQWFKKSEDTLNDFHGFTDPSKREFVARIFDEIKGLYSNHQNLVFQTSTIVERLDKDQLTASQMIQAGKRWGLKDDFEKYSSEHKSLLELLDLYNRQSEELLKRFNNIRQSCLAAVVDAMQTAARLQQSITTLRKNDLQVILSATKKEKEDFFYLRFVHELSSTFDEIVKELHRRVSWKRHVSKFLSISFPSFERGLLELGKEIEEERVRRLKFFKKLGPLIPQDLLPLLHADLPHLDVVDQITRLDSTISVDNLSVADLEVFSKEYTLPAFPLPDEHAKLLELLKQAEKGTENALAKWQEAEKILEDTKNQIKHEKEEREREREQRELEKEKFTKESEERERREKEKEALLKEMEQVKERGASEIERLKKEVSRLEEEKQSILQKDLKESNMLADELKKLDEARKALTAQLQLSEKKAEEIRISLTEELKKSEKLREAELKKAEDARVLEFKKLEKDREDEKKALSADLMKLEEARVSLSAELKKSEEARRKVEKDREEEKKKDREAFQKAVEDRAALEKEKEKEREKERAKEKEKENTIRKECEDRIKAMEVERKRAEDYLKEEVEKLRKMLKERDNHPTPDDELRRLQSELDEVQRKVDRLNEERIYRLSLLNSIISQFKELDNPRESFLLLRNSKDEESEPNSEESLFQLLGKHVELYTYHIKYLEDKLTALMTDMSEFHEKKQVVVKNIKVGDRVILFPIWGNQDTYQVFTLDDQEIKMVLDKGQDYDFRSQIRARKLIVGTLIFQETAQEGEGGAYQLGSEQFQKVTLGPF